MFYTLVFVIVGTLLVVSGLQQGGPALVILVWLGFSGVVNGLGHLGFGATVFGKKASGTLPIWSKVIHLPFLAATWLIWYLICRLSRENPYDFVTENLVVGRRVYPKEIDREFTNWVDMTAEFDEPRGFRERDGYIALPVLDGGVPSARALRAALEQIQEGPTFVHCAQGHGRAALFALVLLLIRGETPDIESGLQLLKKVRPGIHLNGRQRRFAAAFVQDFARQDAAA